MEEVLRSYLISSDGIPANTNWGSAPEGSSLPGVVLNVASDVSDMTQQGPSGFSTTRVQIDVYAETFGQAKKIARSIRRALDGYSGVDFTAFRISEYDGGDMGDDPGSRIFRNSHDYQISWTFE